MNKLDIDIIGAAGYTGGELIRILFHHPAVNSVRLVSQSQAGKAVGEIHQDLAFEDLLFTDSPSAEPDITFLCMGHGKSREWLKNNNIKGRIIDLSQDYRLENNAEGFVYGLPEYQRDIILKSEKIANPGCFATAIQLALLPLAAEDLLKDTVHIHGITGSTGAGQSPTQTTHFSWRNNNVSLYKVFEHQHLNEIRETLSGLQGDLPELLFTPVRGNFTRGIFISAYTRCALPESKINELYADYYQSAVFTHVSDQELHLKQVVNTNNCFVHASNKKGYVYVTTIIDNLLKGASGQAVQNMNLMFGLNEDTGLHLKSTYF